MKIPTLVGTAVLAILGTFQSTHAQQLITNGSFETPSVPTVSVLGIGLLPGAQTYNSGSSAITGWSVGSGSVSIVDAGGTLASTLGLFTPATGDGNQYAVLNGLSVNALGIATIGATGSLTQTLTGLTPGETYHLSFDYAPLSVNAIAGTPILSISVSNTSSNTGPAAGLLSVSLSSWQNEAFDFVASGTTSALTFSEPNYSVGNIALVGIDGVSIMPVPEPSQYAAAAFGFLALLIVGRVLRRRVSIAANELPTAVAA